MAIGNNNSQVQILKNFAEKTAEDVKKVDINIFPEEFEPVYYSKALLNTLKLWLLSGPYDRVRRPNWAGFFTKLLREYSMDEAGAEEIKTRLQAEIQSKIEGVELTEITATPLLGKKMWEVGVGAIDRDTGVFVTNDRENYVTIATDPNIKDEEEGSMAILDSSRLPAEDNLSDF